MFFTLSSGGDQIAMDNNCTMTQVMGYGNCERMVLPRTPLLELTMYQQMQTNTMRMKSLTSDFVTSMIVFKLDSGIDQESCMMKVTFLETVEIVADCNRCTLQMLLVISSPAQHCIIVLPVTKLIISQYLLTKLIFFI